MTRGAAKQVVLAAARGDKAAASAAWNMVEWEGQLLNDIAEITEPMIDAAILALSFVE